MSAATAARSIPPAAQVLDQRFRRDGFTPMPLALITDLAAVAEAGCQFCERRGTVEALPYWGDGCRLLCLCHGCNRSWES